MNDIDRLEKLLAQSQVTGIDYIYVNSDQVALDVYFLRPPATLDVPLTDVKTPDKIRIYNPSGTTPDIPVTSLDWDALEGKGLRLKTAFPGDFTLYKFRIDDPRVDPFYNDVTFDFKANCPSDLDCAPPEHECPPEEAVDFPVDYLARDFWSFRQALLEFASQRYPDWPDRLEADAGVMLAEMMSAIGDEMAYYQDRVGREAHLETATQRRSLRRHARLVDYHLHDGLGATAWLDITVKIGENGIIAAGKGIWAAGNDGTRVDFAVGKNIEDILSEKSYALDDRLNEFQPHLWDEDEICMPVGATDLFIQGHVAELLKFNDQIEALPGQIPGKWILLQTLPANPAQPVRAHLVRVIKAIDTTDPVLSADITHLIWEEEQALPFELDMKALKVRGNLIPAAAGIPFFTYFVLGADPDDFTQDEWERLREDNGLRDVPRAIEREGREGSVTYLFTLPGSDQLPLVWLGDDPRSAAPEIVLQEMRFQAGTWKVKDADWQWKRALIGVNSSQPQDTHYTMEDGSWRRVVGYQRGGEEFVHQDYASNAGVTIRFGDGEFGRIPDEKTVFRVTYRLGGTRRSNVAADTLNHPEKFPDFVERVSNPLPASGGLDAETPAELRQLAPDAFRAVTHRAVRPEDYAEVAERLSWVQHAGATFRWTGSWLSAFVTPDPRQAYRLEENRRTELVRQLDRFRQAGREAHVMDPLYANIDLEIDICAMPSAYRGEVKARVLEALLGKKGIQARQGYFAPDRFTFGTPLDRSTLEAAIQAVPGVRAVEVIRFRRRAWFDWRTFDEMTYSPGKNAIIRVENNPLRPGNGTLKLHTHGGA